MFARLVVGLFASFWRGDLLTDTKISFFIVETKF